VTRGYLALPPVWSGTSRYYQKLTWSSAQFAIMADLALVSLGGTLKRKEKITGRFADALAWMYFVTCMLKRYEEDGRLAEDRPLLDWAVQYGFHQIQVAFDGITSNMGILWRLTGKLIRLNPIGALPSDDLGHRMALGFQRPGAFRDRHTERIFVSQKEGDPLRDLEDTFQALDDVKEIDRAISLAVRAKQISKASPDKMAEQAINVGLINQQQGRQYIEAQQRARMQIQVDSFTIEEYYKGVKRETEQS